MKRDEQEFSQYVGKKAARKQRARRRRTRHVWFGLGLFGVVGWSVVVPILLGVAAGIWVDTRWPSPWSWTLMLLFLGVMVGCLNAWFWVTRERELIEQEFEEGVEDE